MHSASQFSGLESSFREKLLYSGMKAFNDDRFVLSIGTIESISWLNYKERKSCNV
jgi:hypothetical protein